MDYAKELAAMDDDTLQRRMHEGAPNSDWWTNLKTELEIRIMQRQLASAKSLAESAGQQALVSAQMKDSARRLEKATWLLLIATVILLLLSEPCVHALEYLYHVLR